VKKSETRNSKLGARNVTPAKAGVRSAMDSRFRGNDPFCALRFSDFDFRASVSKGGSMNSASDREHSEGGVKVFMVVWFWLLALTGVEVFLGYKAFAVKIMTVLLMGLSVIKASLIIAYFMHLRYEKPSMAATLMPALVMVILLMFMVFPDSFRLLAMRPH
jgi:cytochrome c oxidase subunit 4